MRSRVGDTKASLPDADDAGIADLEFGEGRACDDRCNAGEEIEAWRSEGVKLTLLLA